MADNRYYFGRSIAFSFTAGKGDVDPNSIVSARIYDHKPSEAELDDETDTLNAAVERVVSWADGSNSNEKIITFSDIPDPNPDDSDNEEPYYIVVNFKWEFGGPTIRSRVAVIWLQRATVLTSRYGVTSAEVYAVESKLENLKGSAWVDTKILFAEELVEADLADRIDGFEIDRLAASDAKQLVRVKAAALAANDISAETGDRWDENAKEHEKHYNQLFAKAKLRYDYNDDGEAEISEVTNFGVVTLSGR